MTTNESLFASRISCSALATVPVGCLLYTSLRVHMPVSVFVLHHVPYDRYVTGIVGFQQIVLSSCFLFHVLLFPAALWGGFYFSYASMPRILQMLASMLGVAIFPTSTLYK